MMRNLARELELGANLNIELNNMEVLSDAVDSMIKKLGYKTVTEFYQDIANETRDANDIIEKYLELKKKHSPQKVSTFTVTLSPGRLSDNNI